MISIEERLKRLEKELGSDRFLENRGLGNEIPFYIFDYDPKHEMHIRSFVRKDLLKRYKGSEKIRLIEIDLFDLMIDRLKKEELFDSSFKLEEKRGTEKLYEKLKLSINMDIVVEEIRKRAQGKNIILLTGVGKVYPVIRTHKLLENLQNCYDHDKVVLFLPGKYTKREIQLFGIFKNDNYYRAFRLIDPGLY